MKKLQKGVVARLVAAGRRQCPQWQAQYSEPSERGCGAPGRRWAPAVSTVAGAVLRASRRGLRRAWSPLGAGSVHSGRRSTQSLQKGVAARLVAAGRRQCPQWHAQYSELSETGCGCHRHTFIDTLTFPSYISSSHRHHTCI